MTTLSRWFVPVVLAVGLGVVGLFAVAPAQARGHHHDHHLARVIVGLADVVIRGNVPYYRYGNYGYDDRLIIVHDRYRRPTYYRHVPRHVVYRHAPRRVVYRPAPRYGYAPRYDNRYYSYDRPGRDGDRRRDRHDGYDRYND